jgi:hypothetical protein
LQDIVELPWALKMIRLLKLEVDIGKVKMPDLHWGELELEQQIKLSLMDIFLWRVGSLERIEYLDDYIGDALHHFIPILSVLVTLSSVVFVIVCSALASLLSLCPNCIAAHATLCPSQPESECRLSAFIIIFGLCSKGRKI